MNYNDKNDAVTSTATDTRPCNRNSAKTLSYTREWWSISCYILPNIHKSY